jgi:hypothetical protein
MSTYEAKYVICPYYHRADNNTISCEGVMDHSTIKLSFQDTNKLKEYKLSFCCVLDNYSNCLICKALDRKYEEKGK